MAEFKKCKKKNHIISSLMAHRATGQKMLLPACIITSNTKVVMTENVKQFANLLFEKSLFEFSFY